MRRSWTIAALMLSLLTRRAEAAVVAPGSFDEALACSVWLASHDGVSEHADLHRRCVIAVANTYIDAEENSAPPEHQLFTDDVSRHRLGTQASFQPGNRAKLMAENSHQVIAAIRNRQWTVDGDQAWILYDGYLKKDPEKIGFAVSERITVVKGLIREILVANIAVAQ